MLLDRFSTRQSDARRVHRAAELLTSYPFEIWHYGDSIGFEGLLAATDLLVDGRYQAWVHGAVKAWIGRRQPFRELDNTAPGHAICLIYERTSDEAILRAAMELANYLTARRQLEGVYISFQTAPLMRPYGGAEISSEEAALLGAPGPGIFVDCLHFDPPFFVHLGRLLDDQSLVDAAAEQALGYIRLLQDETGFFWHFWLKKSRQRYGLGWARGQSWALLGLLDLLTYLPTTHPARDEIARAFRRLARALLESQQPSGAWPAVAHEPASGPESSTAAFATAGFAGGIMESLLDESFREPAERAWASTWDQLDEGGLLDGVSVAVWASTSPLHYHRVPRGLMVPWGQGPLLLAAKRIAALRSRPGAATADT